MVLLAYLCLLGAVVWLVQGRDVILPGRRLETAVRFLGALLGAGVSAVAILQLSRHTTEPAGTVILAIWAVGGALYAPGVLAWSGRTAYRLRLLGWLAMTLPALIPSTLTLALPLLALLAVTLRMRADPAAA